MKASTGSSFLLSAVGLLAALLAALATVNGGIDRIERNEHWVLFAGVVCVLVAISTGAVYTALTTSGPDATALPVPEAADRPRSRTWHFPLQAILLFGVLALAFGLIAVAYAAVAHVAGRPAVTAAISYDRKLGVLLNGDVTVSDIPASTHLEMRVDALYPNPQNRLSHRVIYAASFGPDSSGDVDHAYEVILPKDTAQVLIQAWTGRYGYCFNSDIPRKTPPKTIANNLGCLRLRIPPALTVGA